MRNLWLKIKIWSKVILGAFLAIFAIVFVLENKGVTVTVWLWDSIPTTVLKLIFFTVVFSVVGTLLLGTAFRTLRQVRELRERNRVAKNEKEMAELRAKASMLQTKPAERKPIDPAP